MEKIVEQALLFDFYGELLTKHQKQIYEDVVLNDLSLSEAAENYGITRQGVHDLIKRCNRILKGYEEKLQLVEKFLTTKKLVQEIYELSQEIEEKPEKKEILKIQKLAKEILEEI
ncbi:MAG: DNA-binding protein [Lachnospiraceae bacterium]|jgi:predicted DNA-binding protein YlxM (UPF0122 family)|nr:DNA-binding protein [Lachnospiraceae bacterium]